MFLKEFGGEATDITAALHFENGVQTEEYCRDHMCEDFDIVYPSDDWRLISLNVGGMDVHDAAGNPVWEPLNAVVDLPRKAGANGRD